MNEPAVVCLHGLRRTPADWDRVQTGVLTGCFFPPARNGRTLRASLADYAGHRVAFVRAARGGSETPSEGSVGALGLLVGQALSRRREPAAHGLPVLVVHARDDHHVPVDFVRAAVARNPRWDARILASGGHHAHVADPAIWLAAVVPWLAGL